MICSGYPLDGLDSVDNNGKSGTLAISSIEHKSYCFILFNIRAPLSRLLKACVFTLKKHKSYFNLNLFCLDEHSALLITMNGKTIDHLDMLNSGIIYRLLEEKWKAFARVRYQGLIT